MSAPPVFLPKPYSKFLKEPYTVALFGAGFKGGQPKPGVEEGPKVLREIGLEQVAKALGWKYKDYGDLKFEIPTSDEPAPSGAKNPRTVGAATNALSNVVAENASKGELCLTLGGDHSLAIGSISGVCKVYRETVVFWIDAHGDINTPETSPSGNIHGMPVAFLAGLVKKSSTPGFEWLEPCLTANRIVFIGLRDVDPGEKRLLKDLNITAFSMTEVDKYGIAKVMEMALDAVNPKRDKPIHLSFDVDAIDPTIVPSTGTKVRGGLTYREARYICTALAETGLLVGVDIVEVNPSIGSSSDVQQTAEVAVDLIKCALGEKLL